MRLEPCNTIISDLVKAKYFSLRSFNRKIPNQTLSKNLTYIDVMALHQYIDSKRINTNIDMEGLQKLYQKSGRHFITGAVSYLMKTYNYPKGLRPHVHYNSNFDGVMAYEPATNTICVCEDVIEDWPKEKILAVIRHEFRHFEQFIDTLRCAKTRLEVVDFYALQRLATEKLNESYKLHKQTTPDTEFDFLSEYMKCLRYGIEHCKEAEYQNKRKIFDNYRRIALKNLGWIMFDTYDSKRAEKIFAEYKDQMYYPVGLMGTTLMQYHTAYHEYDALLSQKVFENQISGNKKCLFSVLKQSAKTFIDTCTSEKKYSKYHSKELQMRIKANDKLTINFLHAD